ncbi:non-homologous end-joining DNA ligase [Desertivibrio insolitus]|uniref:non-homologous end-joining DNA ligase n=1 Tax=Herbiconiux sp. SYSU D00978 TaxID=2812562 RepID=UPI001A96CF23|nr:non-homologous end-joining DNA ligase [Herbiconiux sp. SYSU D00978]
MAADAETLTIPGPDGARSIRLTSGDRDVFPGVTKRDLVDYLLAVSEPFLRINGDRPVALQRFRGGLEGEEFFSKNPPKGTPDFFRTVDVTFPSRRVHPMLVFDEPAELAWAVQMGTVVFHPWPSRAADTDHPDQLRLDLDPQPGTGFAEAVPAAHELRSVLEEAGLAAFVKTSGNRGIHVFAPIAPEWDFIDVRHAAIAAARELERRMPQQVTTAWWKEERGERIFVDFNQTARDRTIAGAYSTRALPHAPVSTPLEWDELTDASPRDLTVRTVPALLERRGDPWARFHERPGRLDALLEWWERDVASGQGEMPYPPEYPKMPGEPMRVQPSRAKKPAE